LQDFRSTLIPAIAVPVAIIGTFSSYKFWVLHKYAGRYFAMILATGCLEAAQ
jgi:multidrug efflux pump subunit AcrB